MKTARGELLFLLGANSPLPHCLHPLRSRPLEREAGIVSFLGTDAVTKSTFLSATSCPSPAAGCVPFAGQSEPDAPGIF